MLDLTSRINDLTASVDTNLSELSSSVIPQGNTENETIIRDPAVDNNDTGENLMNVIGLEIQRQGGQ